MSHDPSTSNGQVEDSTSAQNAPLPIDGPKISNIVCGANLNCRFDLRHIALYARNVDYRPKRFPAAIIRLREPKATGLVFQSGKLQILGTKSTDSARLACRKFARILQKMGYQPRIENFAIQNIVAHADTKMLIRLEGLQYAHSEFCKYEPEIFPGLNYTVLRPKMTVLVFARGKLILLGAKVESELDEAMRALYPVLCQFRRV